ncbi:tyrosine-type recombinase/integrase [Catenulispora subtropica]|uniref:tyrosine-type recombinase/integrase n=1 Tax=Catenulispora subtropica TaxID=450798 RepID=UPI0031D70652
MLKTHRRCQDAECRDRSVVPSEFVFTRADGQPLASEYLYRRLVKLTAEHGLPPIRLHDLRHGAASLALQAGVDLKVVSDQLGHSSIVLTADTYVSVLSALAMKAAEATARLVAEAGRRAPGSKHVTRRKPSPPDPSGRGKHRRGSRRPMPSGPSTSMKSSGRSEIGSVAAGKGGRLRQPAGTTGKAARSGPAEGMPAGADQAGFEQRRRKCRRYGTGVVPVGCVGLVRWPSGCSGVAHSDCHSRLGG